MPDNDLNPYASPIAEPGSRTTFDPQVARPRRSIWRFMVMIVCFLIGGLAFAIGLTIVGCLFYFLLTVNAFDAMDEMLPNAALYLGFGGGWLLASWCFWHRKDLWGVLAFLASVLFPFILLWILNMYSALAD